MMKTAVNLMMTEISIVVLPVDVLITSVTTILSEGSEEDIGVGSEGDTEVAIEAHQET